MSLQSIEDVLPRKMFRAEKAKPEGDEITITCKNCSRVWELEHPLAIAEILGQLDQHTRACRRGRRWR